MFIQNISYIHIQVNSLRYSKTDTCICRKCNSNSKIYILVFYIFFILVLVGFLKICFTNLRFKVFRSSLKISKNVIKTDVKF